MFPSSLLSRNLSHLAARSLLVARIRYAFVECQIDVTLELFQHLLAVLGESRRLPGSLFAILLALFSHQYWVGQAVWNGEAGLLVGIRWAIQYLIMY